jgi:hypothetical protein
MNEQSKACTRCLTLTAVLKDVLGDLPDVQHGICVRCGRDYSDEPALEGQDCPSDDCPGYDARRTLAAQAAEVGS